MNELLREQKKSRLYIVFRKLFFMYMSLNGYLVAWLLSHPVKLPFLQKPRGMKYEDISFQSPHDGLLLKGWWLPSNVESEKAVIFAHGYRGHRNDKQFLCVAKVLVAHGYHVLMFDFRSCCQSQGKITTVGILEQQDLLGAIAYAKQVKKAKSVAILGWSMGAASAILAAGQSREVRAVICDSPFDDLEGYLNENLSKWTRLPQFFNKYVLQGFQKIAGQQLHNASPIKQVAATAHASMLFIHSKADSLIPHAHSKRLYEAAKGQKELWLTDGARHIESHRLHEAQYHQKILSFLNRHL